MTNTALSALVNGAIAAAILAAAVRLSLLLIPRTIVGASARYAIWWAMLVATLLLPLAYFPVHRVTGAGPFATAAQQQEVRSQQTGVRREPTPVALETARAGAVFRLTLPLVLPTDGAPRWLLVGWVFLSAAFLLRLFASLCLLARCRLGAVPAPVELARSVEAALLAHDSSRRAAVLTSPTIAAPVLAGLHRPTVLIPERLLAELSEPELIAVALHEAGHVARRDDYALLAERLIQSICPAHPVAWWICRQIGLEREIACDAFAVEAIGSPRRYAASLLRAMELCSGARVSWAAAGMAAGRSQLARRVDTLLAAGHESAQRPCKLRLLTAIAIVAAFACFAVRTPRAVAFSAPPPPQQPAGSAQQTSKDLPVVSIQKDGEIYLNEKPCNIHELEAAIHEKFGMPDAVYVRADKETIYDAVAAVTDELRNDGLKVILVTQPAESPGRGRDPGRPEERHAAANAAAIRAGESAALAPPLSIALVVDRSGSMRNNESLLDTAITALAQSANPADEFLLVTFNDAVDVAGPFPSDGARILEQVHREAPRGGTSLRDAMLRATRWSGARYPNRALIVISDGNDNSSSISSEQLREGVIRANVPVWAITLAAPSGYPRPASRWLGDLVSRTHGREFVTDNADNIAPIAAQIVQSAH